MAKEIEEIENEIDDISDEELEATRRHKEMSGVLKSILGELKKESGAEEKILKFIEANNGNIAVFLDKLKEVATPKIEAPNVSVSVNNDELSKALLAMEKNIVNEVKDLKELIQQLIMVRTCDVEMNVAETDYYGAIKKVKVKTIVPNIKTKYDA